MSWQCERPAQAAPAAATRPALAAQLASRRNAGLVRLPERSQAQLARRIAASQARQAAAPVAAAAASVSQGLPKVALGMALVHTSRLTHHAPYQSMASYTLQSAAELQQQQRADPAELPPLLSGVRIVLVSPKTPVNIGAVLRVAENFEVRTAMAGAALLRLCTPCSSGSPAAPVIRPPSPGPRLWRKMWWISLQCHPPLHILPTPRPAGARCGGGRPPLRRALR